MGLADRIPADLKEQPVWGVVSSWSCDVLYEGKTYEQAREFARMECEETPGQHAVVVLLVETFDGPPMRKVNR